MPAWVVPQHSPAEPVFSRTFGLVYGGAALCSMGLGLNRMGL